MPNKPDLHELRIRTGKIISPQMVALLLEDKAMAESDVPYTEVSYWQSGKDWFRSSIKYNGVSVDFLQGKDGVKSQLVIVGDNGQFTLLFDNKGTEGVIKDENSMTCVKVVYGSIMAVGIVGAVFRLKGQDTWEDLTDKQVEENIEGICGYPHGGFLVCGWQGLAAHYNEGKSAKRIETGTKVILSCITCDETGEIIACGQRGTILRGTIDSLKPLKLAGIADDFWSVAKFKGEIYVASTAALYKLVNDTTLELVKFPAKNAPTSFYHLDTYQDSLMLSAGQNDAFLFDGKKWTRIL